MVEQPSQDEKEVLLGQYSSLSPSPAHTQPTSTLSRIKFIEVVIVFDYVPHIFTYVYMQFYMYAAIQHWLNIQKYKVGIKGKVEQSRERSSALHYLSV